MAGGARAALLAVFLAGTTVPLGATADDGFPICAAAGDQWNVVACSDGAGGAILAWLDGRSGSGTDIFAQRVGQDGAPVWAPDGVPVCVAPGDQADLRILADGTVGAFVAWEDRRSGDTDLRIQRLTAVGVPEPGWPGDGLVVSAAPGVQGDAALAPDGHGGVYIAWADFSAGFDGNIYLHHVLPRGVLDPGWPVEGRVLCAAGGLQRAPAAVADAAGGVVVAWEDGRNGHTDIFAQRLTAADTLGWEPGGHAVCILAGDQQRPALAADDSGGVFVAWQDLRGAYYDIYLQHLAPDLEYEWWWPLLGLLVCGAAGGQFEPHLLADGSGGSFVAWFDSRAGSHYDVFAQRVTDRARVLWEPGGQAVATAPGDQTRPRIASDAAGGLFLGWTDRRATASADIYVARLAPEGTRAACWPEGGLDLCTAAGDQEGPVLVTLGPARALVAWTDGRSGAARDIYARVASNADTDAGAWPAGGTAVVARPGDQLPGSAPATAVGDGAGGFVVAWNDTRPGAEPAVRAQRIDPVGRALWSAEGVLAGRAAPASALQVVPDGTGGAFIGWEDDRLDAADVVAQHLRGDGTALWAADGLEVAVRSGLQLAPQLVRDAGGGVFVLWHEKPAEPIGADFDLRAVRLAADGGLAPGWPAGGASVCGAPGDQLGARIIPNDEGGFLAVWLDARLAGPPVLQGVGFTASGGLRAGWTADGLRLARGRVAPRDLQLVQDGSPGGGVLVWCDGPPGTDGVFALRVTAGGQLGSGWPADGLEAHRATTAHAGLVSGADGSGGTLLAWSDEDGGAASVRALRLTGTGAPAPGWPAGGRRVASGTSAQLAPAITGDGSGGAFIAWVDMRPRDADLYHQIVTAAGDLAAPSWVEGVPLAAARGAQERVTLVGNQVACAFAVWSDRRGGDADVFATRLVNETIVSDTQGADSWPRSMPLGVVRATPNPGCGAQRFEFTLVRPGRAAITVYDVAGRRMRRLVTPPLAAGDRSLLWDGRDDAGRRLAPGTYVVRLDAPRGAAGGKLVRRR
jgi:hypothetical protein